MKSERATACQRRPYQLSSTTERDKTSELLDQLHHWLTKMKPFIQAEELNFVEQARAGRALREAFETLEELKSLATEHTEEVIHA